LRTAEAFVAQPAVEAFNEAIQHRLAGRDVVPFDPKLLLPIHMEFDVNSVPLSLTSIRAQPRLSMI
jgi:hypothetical protein